MGPLNFHKYESMSFWASIGEQSHVLDDYKDIDLIRFETNIAIVTQCWICIAFTVSQIALF